MGNAAHVDIWYGADGPLVGYQYADEDEGPRPAFVEIVLDTAYSYKDEHGGCNTLHARLITELTDGPLRGKNFAWENEYTGEWFTWAPRSAPSWSRSG